MEAIERLQSVEVAIYGDREGERPGLLERVNGLEKQVTEIRSAGQKIIWLLIVGVFGALMNLVIGTRNASSISHTLQQITPSPPAAAAPAAEK